MPGFVQHRFGLHTRVVALVSPSGVRVLGSIQARLGADQMHIFTNGLSGTTLLFSSNGVLFFLSSSLAHKRHIITTEGGERKKKKKRLKLCKLQQSESLNH